MRVDVCSKSTSQQETDVYKWPLELYLWQNIIYLVRVLYSAIVLHELVVNFQDDGFRLSQVGAPSQRRAEIPDEGIDCPKMDPQSLDNTDQNVWPIIET